MMTPASGARALGLGSGRDGILHVPSKAGAAPLPLLVLLHGAGGAGAGILRRLGTLPDEAGVAVLAPDSRGSTWDAIRGTIGDDVRFLDSALERVFQTLAVDAARVSVGGFSDGASYALTIGLMNGDLFKRIIAFSPGFVAAGTRVGRPHIFISHGTADEVLPIASCGRPIAARLKRAGYDVTFREFAGGHTVPPNIARDGLRLASSE